MQILHLQGKVDVNWYQVDFALVYKMRIRNTARLVLDNINVPRSKAKLALDIILLHILLRYLIQKYHMYGLIKEAGVVSSMVYL